MDRGAELELICAVRAGSKEAYEELYRRYSQSIYRYCLARLRDAELASDVLQETFLVLWQKADSFSGNSSVSTWLFGVATNKLRAARRDVARLGELQAEPENIAARDHSVETLGLKADVLSAIRLLPPEQQEVVILAFYADLRYSDIAEIQNVPVGTVKSRMFQAKKTLMECLGGLT